MSQTRTMSKNMWSGISAVQNRSEKKACEEESVNLAFKENQWIAYRVWEVERVEHVDENHQVSPTSARVIASAVNFFQFVSLDPAKNATMVLMLASKRNQSMPFQNSFSVG